MVIVRLPSPAFLLVVTFIVELPEPGAAMDDGENVTVNPLPCPEAEKPIAELNPPRVVVVIVDVPDELRPTENDAGEAETVKSAETAGVTVSETDVVCVRPPPVPVIVMLYVPGVVFDDTVKVAVEVPEPGAPMEVGLNVTVTPVGVPDADSETAELNPPETAVVMVEDPLLPAVTERDPVEEEIVKAGVPVDVPVRAPSRPAFGLPQPVTRSYPVTAE